MNEGKRIAILIASSRFPYEPALQVLRCPENDVDGLSEVLKAPEYGAFDHVIIFKNKNHNEVLSSINRVFKQASQYDQIFIYFSGHGKTDDPGRLYLATTDTQIDILESTSIPIENIRTYIENSKCRSVALILDCCYSGAAGKSFVKGDVDEQLKLMSRGSGIYLFTASTAFQTASEREGDRYGLLTKHILTGIKEGKAYPNEDGFITIEGLYNYVRREVIIEGAQQPMRWAINVRGEDLIVARTNRLIGREKKQLLTDKVIEIRDYLPSGIFLKALEVIQEPRAPFYDLIDKLYRKHLQIGEFIDEWGRIESSKEAQGSESSLSLTQQQPEKPAKMAAPLPPRQTLSPLPLGKNVAASWVLPKPTPHGLVKTSPQSTLGLTTEPDIKGDAVSFWSEIGNIILIIALVLGVRVSNSILISLVCVLTIVFLFCYRVMARVPSQLYTLMVSYINYVSTASLNVSIIIAGGYYGMFASIMGCMAVALATTGFVSGFITTNRILKTLRGELGDKGSLER